MPQITVGFSKPRKWFVPFSWIIRLANGTPFSHTYIKLYSSSLERDLIYEAMDKGLVFSSAESFDTRNETLKEFTKTITEQQKKIILQFCVDNALGQYSVLQNVGIIYVKFMLCAFGAVVKNPWPGGWNCTEVLARLTILLGIPFHADPDCADLDDIFEAWSVLN
jgi:hypothetical protein